MSILGLFGRPAMAPQDLAVILNFARGDDSPAAREASIAVHWRYILELGVRGTPEMAFMAEVDHPSPDLTLRQHYRQRLLELHPEPEEAPSFRR